MRRSRLPFIVLVLSSTQAWISPSLVPSRRSTTTDPPNGNVQIVILPGFGNDSNDYRLPQAPQGSLVQSLHKRGWEDVQVLPVNRLDWLRVFINGLFDIQFWLGRAEATNPAFRWYLERVGAAIDAAANDEKNVLLVCHSAGGWLARAALGYQVVQNTTSRVCGLVSLGSPHVPPPVDRMDMTRGALRATHTKFPGTFHNQTMFYVTVAGDAIQGIPPNKEEERSSAGFLGPPSATEFAFNSYEAVCGEGTAIGDGVVPISHAHLDGATQLTLQGIFHSINVSTPITTLSPR